jgi:hypothetical protein
MDGIGNGRSELEAGAGSIQQHRLNLALEEAKAATTAGAGSGSGSDPAHVLDSVHITMETPMANDKGWNVIALDYIVAPPLNAVITPAAVAKYKRVFGMMWRLQRLEHCLTRVWLTTVTSATHIFSKAFKDTPGMPFSTSHHISSAPCRAGLRCAVLCGKVKDNVALQRWTRSCASAARSGSRCSPSCTACSPSLVTYVCRRALTPAVLGPLISSHSI